MSKATGLPDVDDMLRAGMPLWAAFQLWGEMMSNQDKPHSHWWEVISCWQSKPTTH